MTYENAKAINMIAGEDLRGDLYEALTIENDGGKGKVIKATAVNQVIVGVLGEEPRTDKTTDGENVPVVLLDGIIKVKAGGNVTAGNLAKIDTGAPGRVVNAGATIAALAADEFACGIFLDSGADGDIVRLLAMPLTSATET